MTPHPEALASRPIVGGRHRLAQVPGERINARARQCLAPTTAHRSCRGLMLVEVLVVLMLLTIVLGIGGLAYHDVMSLGSAQGHYKQRRASAEFFLRHFAQDVREAQTIDEGTLSKGAPSLLLAMPEGGRVAYFMEGRALQRSASVPGQKEQKMPMLSDRGMAVRFNTEQIGGRARSVVATVEWEEPPSIGISHPILSLRVALRGQP